MSHIVSRNIVSSLVKLRLTVKAYKYLAAVIVASQAFRPATANLHCSGRMASDEVAKAQKAEITPEPTIFSKIIDKSIPADILFEDDKVSGKSIWLHMRVNTPVTLTLVPNKKIKNISQISKDHQIRCTMHLLSFIL